VTDPTPVTTSCAPTFEVAVTALVAEDPTSHPGGALDVTDPAGCLAGLDGASPARATVRAGGWVLVRGAGVAATQAGRPSPGTEHVVVGPRVGYVPELGGEVGDPVARALAFTLQLAPGVTAPPRGTTLVLDTSEGRSPFRAVEGLGLGVEPRAVVPFDRSRYAPAASDPSQAAALQASGLRFLVPYASGVVLDASPTQAGGGAASMR
jgi:hypothetical protein